MEVKSTEWRPGPTVCRCCLSEGCYKDISTEYFWMGKREVYAEMLSETFDVTIGFSKSGGPNSNSRLICEPCISRLRDASEFKRQVLECEKTFMQHLDPGTSTSADLDITVDTDKEVKLERVKTEKRLSDDDFDDRVGFDDDDDDDDLDDEPLTKLASKVPKKESVDLLDLLDNAKVAEKRKSTAKTKSTPAKKSKKETIQPTPSKSVKIEKKKKETRPVSSRGKAKRNAAVLLQYSTMYPFRMQSKYMRCVFCRFTSEEPTEYRRHLDTDHRTFLVRAAVCHITTENEYLKVDITALKCRTCLESFECLDDIAVHIRDVHRDIGLDLNYELGCMPFKMDGKKWICAVCKKKFSNLVTLNRHTTSHFCDYICDVCGKTYLSQGSLKYHRKIHQIAEFACRRCLQAFATKEERIEHVKTTPSCWNFVCLKCMERFQSWERKQRHMVEEHGLPKRTYQCPECAKRYEGRKAFHQHYKFNHSDDAFICTCCGKKLTSKKHFEEHKLVHSGEKMFQCNVCSKTFSLEKNLLQHMWVHNENKRFKCSDCDKQFSQKVSLIGHLKRHHHRSFVL